MYEYQKEKPSLFTEDGQKMFLEIRDRVKKLIEGRRCFRMEEAIRGTCGSSWQMLACVDRMVELGELREIGAKDCAGQNRVFMGA